MKFNKNDAKNVNLLKTMIGDNETVKGGCKMQEIGGLKLSVFLHFLYTHFINLLRKW